MYTKYNISNHKQQLTYVDVFIMLKEQKLKFIQRKIMCGSNQLTKDCIQKELITFDDAKQ